MAVARLSPWPSTPAALASAIARLKAAVGADSDERASGLGDAAAAMVEQYAPGAPAAIKDEAVIRLAGYLAEANFGARQSLTVGPMEASYVASHANAFRNSGAAGLLSRWRVRRAGAIG